MGNHHTHSKEKILLFGNNSKPNKYFILDTIRKRLCSEKLSSKIKLKDGMSIQCLGNDFYLFMGGQERDETVINSCFTYSVKAKEQGDFPYLLYSRSDFGSILYKESIYAIGGVGSNRKPLARCEVIKKGCDAWETIDDLPVPLVKPVCFVYRDRLCVIGIQRWEHQDGCLKMYRLSKETDNWEEMSKSFYHLKNLFDLKLLPSTSANEVRILVQLVNIAVILRINLLTVEILTEKVVNSIWNFEKTFFFPCKEDLYCVEIRPKKRLIRYGLGTHDKEENKLKTCDMKKINLNTLNMLPLHQTIPYSPSFDKPKPNDYYNTKNILIGSSFCPFEATLDYDTGGIEISSKPIRLRFSRHRHFCRINKNEIVYLDDKNESFLYNLLTREIVSVPSLKGELYESRLVYLNGFIYVIGGRDNLLVNRLNLKKMRWEAVSAMKYERYNPILIARKDKLYVISSEHRSPSGKLIQVYHEKTDKWEILHTKLPRLLFKGRAVETDDRIVFFEQSFSSTSPARIAFTLPLSLDWNIGFEPVERVFFKCEQFEHVFETNDLFILKGRRDKHVYFQCLSKETLITVNEAKHKELEANLQRLFDGISIFDQLTVIKEK